MVSQSNEMEWDTVSNRLLSRRSKLLKLRICSRRSLPPRWPSALLKQWTSFRLVDNSSSSQLVLQVCDTVTHHGSRTIPRHGISLVTLPTRTGTRDSTTPPTNPFHRFRILQPRRNRPRLLAEDRSTPLPIRNGSRTRSLRLPPRTIVQLLRQGREGSHRMARLRGGREEVQRTGHDCSHQREVDQRCRVGRSVGQVRYEGISTHCR